MGELAFSHRDVLTSLPRAFFEPLPGIVVAAKADGVQRWQAVDYQRRRAGASKQGWKPEDPPEFAALPMQLRIALETREYPKLLSRWGVRGGLMGDVAGFDQPAYGSLVFLISAFQDDPAALGRLLALSGVTHLGSRHMVGLERFPLRAVVHTAAIGEVYLSRVPNPLPRAYAVSGVRVVPAGKYSVLLDPAFDPHSEVLLSEGSARPAGGGAAGEVQLIDDRPGRIVLEARMVRAGQQVVLESAAPGWRATVDGVGVAVQTANHLFVSVPVGVGTHKVQLTYHAPGLSLGVAMTGFGGLAAAVLLLRVRIRQRALVG